MVPLTIIFAPLSLFAEKTALAEGTFAILMLVGGPLLYALYALLVVLPGRSVNIAIAIVLHSVCFIGAMMLKQGL